MQHGTCMGSTTLRISLSLSYSPENLVYAMLWCECVWVRLCISDIPSGELPYQSPLKFAWPRAKLEDKNNPLHERRRRRRKIFLFLIWPNFFYQVLAGSNKNWIKAAIFLCEISLGHLCGNFFAFFWQSDNPDEQVWPYLYFIWFT